MPALLIWYLEVLLIVGAIIAIVYVVLNQTGIGIPPFVARIFWIVVAVVVGIIAIKLLAGML